MGLFSFVNKKQSLVNSASTPVRTIVDQMNEPRPLPMGQKEFVEWSDRIISGALIPCDDKTSLIKTLASMIMNLGPTESHKPDAYFIHALRKAAVNEVANYNFQEIQRMQQERFKAHKAEVEAKAAAEANANVAKTIAEARVSNLNPVR